MPSDTPSMQHGGRRLIAAMPVVGVCTILVIVGIGGCRNASSLDVHPIAGKVTFDGQPVEDGLITFNGVSGDTRGFAGRIERGLYKVETFAGPMKVSITAQREIPGTFIQAAPDQPKEPAREQYIPARYNEATELEADVPRGGIRELNFDLEGGAEK